MDTPSSSVSIIWRLLSFILSPDWANFVVDITNLFLWSVVVCNIQLEYCTHQLGCCGTVANSFALKNLQGYLCNIWTLVIGEAEMI
jgi:hypothetical protein